MIKSNTIDLSRLWVDNIEYQSNTVIFAELVYRGRPQPVHKALGKNDFPIITNWDEDKSAFVDLYL